MSPPSLKRSWDQTKEVNTEWPGSVNSDSGAVKFNVLMFWGLFNVISKRLWDRTKEVNTECRPACNLIKSSVTLTYMTETSIYFGYRLKQMRERAETRRQAEDSQQGQLVCKLFNFLDWLTLLHFNFANLQTNNHSISRFNNKYCNILREALACTQCMSSIIIILCMAA